MRVDLVGGLVGGGVVEDDRRTGPLSKAGRFMARCAARWPSTEKAGAASQALFSAVKSCGGALPSRGTASTGRNWSTSGSVLPARRAEKTSDFEVRGDLDSRRRRRRAWKGCRRRSPSSRGSACAWLALALRVEACSANRWFRVWSVPGVPVAHEQVVIQLARCRRCAWPSRPFAVAGQGAGSSTSGKTAMETTMRLAVRGDAEAYPRPAAGSVILRGTGAVAALRCSMTLTS